MTANALGISNLLSADCMAREKTVLVFQTLPNPCGDDGAMGPLHCPICIGLGLLCVTRTVAWLGLGRLLIAAEAES